MSKGFEEMSREEQTRWYTLKARQVVDDALDSEDPVTWKKALETAKDYLWYAKD